MDTDFEFVDYAHGGATLKGRQWTPDALKMCEDTTSNTGDKEL